MPRTTTWVAAALVVLASCGGSSTADEAGQTVPSSRQDGTGSSGVVDTVPFSERMDAIGHTVAVWSSANSIEDAWIAAESVANLVVGPNGPGYGDRNGDGAIDGTTTVGVLAGLDGTPPGLATPLAGNECVARDVLGGTWTDPAAEWEAMRTAIDNWRRDNNTMPTLASHPMRIVGWATFTLHSDSLDEAHEYAGHAQLHVDIAQRALDC